MTTKPESELNFKKSSEPIPTVEIDTDSISDLERMRTIRRTLASLASKEPSMRATIYVHATVSFNFHEMTNSDFIGVAGPLSILQALQSELSRLPGARSRLSDYISTRESVMAYHLEHGNLWVPEDALTWSSVESRSEDGGRSPQSLECDDTGTEKAVIEEIEDELPEEDEVNLKGFRIESAARYRAARADASIGSIKRQIESVFGLPEGSVALCGPDGKALRSDARIATLRRRWD
ncbi:hypothetical protein [Paraburkholderia bryophila]|uniref:Uncharacterized protein n=1 Tax=Paraburkholderia bryophila TaxID=420952 RepID=A0A329CM11_9BURK|nr:hypothetical protein [Paraburkholderia bryophila]RAS31905.1 hypothetical protein BX591_10810 [Paraburkholderia bryophila]